MDSSDFLLLASYHPHPPKKGEKLNIHESQGSIYKWDIGTGTIVNTTPHQDYHPPPHSIQSMCLISPAEGELFEDKKKLSTKMDPNDKPLFLAINGRTSSLNYYTHPKTSPLQRYHLKEKGITCIESDYWMDIPLIWASTQEGHLMAWNRFSGSLIFSKQDAHLQSITSIKILGNGEVLTTSLDGYAKIWSISLDSSKSPSPFLCITSPNNEGITSVDVGFGFGRNRRLLICSGELISIFDLVDAKFLFSISVPLLSVASFGALLQRVIFAGTLDGKIFRFVLGSLDDSDTDAGAGAGVGVGETSNIVKFEGHKESAILTMITLSSLKDKEGYLLITGDSLGELIIWSSSGEIIKRLANPLKDGGQCNQIIPFSKRSLDIASLFKVKHSPFKAYLESSVDFEEYLDVCSIINIEKPPTTIVTTSSEMETMQHKLNEIQGKYEKLKAFVDENC